MFVLRSFNSGALLITANDLDNKLLDNIWKCGRPNFWYSSSTSLKGAGPVAFQILKSEFCMRFTFVAVDDLVAFVLLRVMFLDQPARTFNFSG